MQQPCCSPYAAPTEDSALERFVEFTDATHTAYRERVQRYWKTHTFEDPTR